MVASCELGGEATTDLVFSLSTRVEHTEVLLNAELNPLLIAGLEMQGIVVAQTPPVAAIKCVIVEETKGSSAWAFFVYCEHQHHRICHGLTELVKETGRKVRMRASAVVGIAIAVVEDINHFGCDAFTFEA